MHVTAFLCVHASSSLENTVSKHCQDFSASTMNLSSTYFDILKGIILVIQEGIRNWDDRMRGITEGKLKELQDLLGVAETIILPSKRTVLGRSQAYQHLVQFLETEAPQRLRQLKGKLKAVQQSCFRRFLSWLGRTVAHHNELDAGLDIVKAGLKSKVDQLQMSPQWAAYLIQASPRTNIAFPLPEACPLFADRLADLAHFILRRDARVIIITSEGQ